MCVCVCSSSSLASFCFFSPSLYLYVLFSRFLFCSHLDVLTWLRIWFMYAPFFVPLPTHFIFRFLLFLFLCARMQLALPSFFLSFAPTTFHSTSLSLAHTDTYAFLQFHLYNSIKYGLWRSDSGNSIGEEWKYIYPSTLCLEYETNMRAIPPQQSHIHKYMRSGMHACTKPLIFNTQTHNAKNVYGTKKNRKEKEQKEKYDSCFRLLLGVHFSLFKSDIILILYTYTFRKYTFVCLRISVYDILFVRSFSPSLLPHFSSF